MLELETNMIDVGRNPGKAIEKISNPILEQLREKGEIHVQPKIEDLMNYKNS